ncbi:amidohydrolase [Anoxynatronum sibiricum]|uniref:Amidohydrolase n=1 Tax=Anoxynatronum sibiricum TaxID=210623 RepID=A0ABU9VVB8_9CLOT
MNPENLTLVKTLRHELHKHPEPSNEETWTKNHLIQFLNTHTQLDIKDRGRWFYAIYRGKNPHGNVAFRADFDAILMNENLDIPHASRKPGVAHKCGHDGHAASLAGLALEIDQLGADHNVFFLFQHAEETGDGAAECVAFINEEDIDEIFAFHNWSEAPKHAVMVIDGTAHFASRGMTIHLEGVPTHASQPEYGRNPAYAVARLISALPELTSPDHNKGLVLATVIQVAVGERAFGIAASKGDLLLTIRAQYEEELDRLQNELEKLAEQFAKEEGLKVSFSYNDVFPVTSNHAESTEKVRQVCKKQGRQLIEMEMGFRGSEDFGHYLKQTKGAIFYVGNGEHHPPLHTYEYDFPDDIIETVVSLFKGLVSLE